MENNLIGGYKMTVLELLEKYPNLINATIDGLEFVGDRVDDQDYTNATIDSFTPVEWHEIEDYLKVYFIEPVEFEFTFKGGLVRLFSEEGLTVITDYYNKKDDDTPSIFESNNKSDLWTDLVYYADNGRDDFTGVEEQSYTQYYFNKVRKFLTNKEVDDEKVN